MSRLLLALLLACAVSAHADDVRNLQWSELIPEGAPPPPPPMAMHDMSQLADALAAAQQSPAAPVVEALDGLMVKLPGYIVPLDMTEEGRVIEFLLVPASAPAFTCHRRRPTRSCMPPASWACGWKHYMNRSGSRGR